ncbi:MAG: DNA-directed RNA polymerase subunit alpha C-terminal domain-containing protein [Planctomycetota bacterium]
MTSAVEADIQSIITGHGPFGPAEVKSLIDSAGTDKASHRSIRLAVNELESTPDRSPATAVRLGVCQYLLGRSQHALETLKTADGGAMALYYQGLAHLATEGFEKAKDAFSAAAGAGYDSVACVLGKAEALRSLGKQDEAKQEIEALGTDAESSADYWCQRASLLGNSVSQAAEVNAFLQKSLAIDSGHSGALFAMAVFNDRLGNDADAKNLYQQSLKRYPASIGALVNLGLLFEDADDYANAQRCYKRILETYPDHPRARLYLKDSSASSDLLFDEDQQKQKDRLDQILSLPVSDFELSVRSRNCLQKMGLMTLGDLARTSENEILESKNFGETSLVEIREMLASKGLSLGQLVESVAEVEPLGEIIEPTADEQEILSQPLSELNLSVRAKKCTTKLGIQTIGDLVRRTGDDLMECKNFGVTSLNEVREKLTERGLKLRGE